jgi:hypothetical protein
MGLFEGGGRIVADARVFEASSKPYRSIFKPEEGAA